MKMKAFHLKSAKALFSAVFIAALSVTFLYFIIPFAARPFIDRYQIIGPKPIIKEELSWQAEEPGWVVDRFIISTSVSLDGLVHLPENENSPWIIFFHGNGGYSLKELKGFYERLNLDQDIGFAIWSYRGYGTSTGFSTRETLHQDSQALANRLFDNWGVNPAQLIVMGFSLGTLPASYLANSLSLEGRAPAAAIFMATGWRPRSYPWKYLDNQNLEVRLRNGVSSPMLITHGELDQIHSIENAKKDFLELEGVTAEFITVPGGHGHLSEPMARQRIKAFINRSVSVK